VLAFVSDQATLRRVSAATLQAALDLTPREAGLVASLVAGHTLRSFSQLTGTSVQTARAHLKNVFRKTGVGSQSALMALVLGLPGTGTGEPPPAPTA
jgi:DNA-binding CsgD family transcriptional regulator